jgi:hypothetical protein
MFAAKRPTSLPKTLENHLERYYLTLDPALLPTIKTELNKLGLASIGFVREYLIFAPFKRGLENAEQIVKNLLNIASECYRELFKSNLINPMVALPPTILHHCIELQLTKMQINLSLSFGQNLFLINLSQVEDQQKKELMSVIFYEGLARAFRAGRVVPNVLLRQLEEGIKLKLISPVSAGNIICQAFNSIVYSAEIFNALIEKAMQKRGENCENDSNFQNELKVTRQRVTRLSAIIYSAQNSHEAKEVEQKHTPAIFKPRSALNHLSLMMSLGQDANGNGTKPVKPVLRRSVSLPTTLEPEELSSELRDEIRQYRAGRH